MLGLKRHEMGIYPAAKGLVAGLIRFRFLNSRTMSNGDNGEDEGEVHDEPWVDCCAQSACEGVKISQKWVACSETLLDMQIPRGGGGGVGGGGDAALPRPKFLVIVEKEGIFHRLCEDRWFLDGVPSIVVTGCGYPDVPSRACVARISARYPELVVVGLCDYNSYGLAVLLTYRLPSRATRFESEGFTVDDLKWVGLRRSAIEELQSAESELDPSHFQPMSERDEGHARAMLRSGKMGQLPDAFAEELEGMLELRVKLELESIYSLGLNTLSLWLKESFDEEQFI